MNNPERLVVALRYGRLTTSGNLTGSRQLVVRMFKVGYWIAKKKDVFVPRISRVLHKDCEMPIRSMCAKRQLVKVITSLH